MKENLSESEKEEFREWIEKLHPYKFHQNDLPDCPNVVSYTTSCEHAEALTNYFKTDDGRIAASNKKVAKIICNEVITIGKFVMLWSKRFLLLFFIQKRKQFKNIKKQQLSCFLNNIISRGCYKWITFSTCNCASNRKY